MQLANFSPERLAPLATLERQARLTSHEIVARRLMFNGITHIQIDTRDDIPLSRL